MTQYSPTHPSIAPDAGTLVPGLASAFRGSINAYVGTVESKAQQSQAFLEQWAGLYGNGAISGGAISAGTGLVAVIAAGTAIVGNIVGWSAQGTVGGLTDDAGSRIWLRQDGFWSAGTAGTAPGTADGHGAALQWGTVHCASGTVAAVSNARTFVQLPYGGTAITIQTGTVTLETGQYCRPWLIIGGTTPGTVQIVLPGQQGAAWDITAGGSAAVQAYGGTGGTVEVAVGKSARVGYGTAGMVRLSADV